MCKPFFFWCSCRIFDRKIWRCVQICKVYCILFFEFLLKTIKFDFPSYLKLPSRHSCVATKIESLFNFHPPPSLNPLGLVQKDCSFWNLATLITNLHCFYPWLLKWWSMREVKTHPPRLEETMVWLLRNLKDCLRFVVTLVSFLFHQQIYFHLSVQLKTKLHSNCLKIAVVSN